MDIKNLIDDIEPYAKGWYISIDIFKGGFNYISTPKQKFNKKKILETIEEGDDVRVIDLTKDRDKYTIMFRSDVINIFHQSKFYDIYSIELKNGEYKKAFDIINEFVIFDAKLKTLL